MDFNLFDVGKSSAENEKSEMNPQIYDFFLSSRKFYFIILFSYQNFAETEMNRNDENLIENSNWIKEFLHADILPRKSFQEAARGSGFPLNVVDKEIII